MIRLITQFYDQGIGILYLDRPDPLTNVDFVMEFLVLLLSIGIMSWTENTNYTATGFNQESGTKVLMCTFSVQSDIWTTCFVWQDLSKFLEDDFDVKDWINNAFRAHKEGNNDVSIFGTFFLKY